MKNIKILVASIIIFSGVSDAFGFVLLGPADLQTTRTLAIGTPASTVWHNITGVGTNDMGGPKELKTFFRVNTPYWTYGFDMSFVRFFGIEGMQAVHDAFHVLNDFFIPRDGSYVGVSSIDFARDGYLSNYNTGWVNATAENLQILDMKSLMLGMLLNQIGVGNPHRYAFSIRGSAITPGITPNPSDTQWNFNVVLRNYDPETWQPTDKINGVTYSYRLIHDANTTAPTATVPLPQVVDMEEFTTDTSGNAWTAVSSITDAFYWNTALFWTGWPTTYDFGVYYDGANSMGGQYQPRHALTYDDVGALKYLYRTNNFVYEDTNGTLIKPAQYLKSPDAQNFDNPDNWFPAFGAGNPSMRGPHPFPRRGGGNIQTPRYTTTSPFRNPNPAGVAFLAGIPVLGGGPGPPVAIMDIALRGGIDKLQFYPVEYDSLMHTVFAPTNFIWTDVFVTNDHFNVLGRSNTTAGASVEFGGAPNPAYASQVLGRTVMVPDIIIVAQDLGRDPVFNSPIAWNRTAAVIGNAPANGWVSYHNSNWESRHVAQPANVYGPGVIDLNGTFYRFGKMNEGFEMIWSGEASMVGNQAPYSLWGHIKGPAPGDLVIFPHASDQPGDMILQMENEVTPRLGVPVISKVSDDNGTSPIAPTSYTRTQETLTIIGSGLAGVTAIEIVSGDLVVQTLFPVKKYLVTDQRIDIPPGVLNFQAEGAARQVQVWNTVGVSEKSKEIFNIYTGPVVLTRTGADRSTYDRAQPLLVYGYGFKSSNVGPTDGGVKLASFRVEDVNGTVLIPAVGGDPTTAASWEVLSDTKALLPINSMTAAADGSFRRLRVSRDLAGLSMSATNNVDLIDNITSGPAITGLNRVDTLGALTLINATPANALQRDTAIRIDGTALNTTSVVEIVNVDGSSFAPPVVVYLPNAGVIVDATGTSIQIAANTFAGMPGADGHSTQLRKLKVSNGIGSVLSTVSFNVNVPPVFTGFAGLPDSGTGAPGGAFNRSATGDDVTIVGRGLRAVSEIEILNFPAGTEFIPRTTIALPSPGVTVTDTSIVIDTSAQRFANPVDSTPAGLTGDRQFRLKSARPDADQAAPITPFIIGIPPVYTSLAGSALLNAFMDFKRDEAASGAPRFRFVGEGLDMLLEWHFMQEDGITQIGGNTVFLTGPAGGNPGVTLTSGTQLDLTVPLPASLNNVLHLIDEGGLVLSGPAQNKGRRRIRVKTPFGTATSDAVDGFRVSAAPVMPTTAPIEANTYAKDISVTPRVEGGGFSGITYTQNLGDAAALPSSDVGALYVNTAAAVRANALHGISSVDFIGPGLVDVTESIDLQNMPAGVTFSTGLGDQIRFDLTYLNSKLGLGPWLNSGGARNRSVRFNPADGQTGVTTATIITQPASTFVTMGGTGYASNHYDRSGNLTVTHASLLTAYGDNPANDYAVLVDMAGTELGGAPGRIFSGSGLTVVGNVATINQALWEPVGELVDSLLIYRNVKLVDGGGGPALTSTRTFTVSDSSIDLTGGADPDEIFSGAGYVGAVDTYDVDGGGTGLLIISCDVPATGRDMQGVVGIEFVDVANTAILMPGTIALSRAAGDFAVSADGLTITITAARIIANGGGVGLVWLADTGDGNLERGFAFLMADGTRSITDLIEIDDTPAP